MDSIHADRLPPLAGYVCDCGQTPSFASGDWRWTGTGWEHHHGYPIGHVIVFHRMQMVWKKGVTKAKKRHALEAIRKHFRDANDNGHAVVFTALEEDTKPIWLFLEYGLWSAVEPYSPAPLVP